MRRYLSTKHVKIDRYEYSQFYSFFIHLDLMTVQGMG